MADNPSAAPAARHLPLHKGGIWSLMSLRRAIFLCWRRFKRLAMQRFIFPFFMHILLRCQIITYAAPENNPAAI